MRPVSIVLAACVAASFAAAQEIRQPAPELQKLARIVGEFAGSGTSRMGADAQESRWTGVQSARWILNGHFLQEDLRVDLGPDAPGPMLMRALVGWDHERKRYVSYNVSNMHPPSVTEPVFVGSDTIVTNRGGAGPDGMPIIGRSVTKLTENGYTFQIEQATGSGPLAIKVKGAFERQSATPAVRAAEAVDAALASGKPPAEIARLQFLLGMWKAKGKMVPAPGIPPMDISGTNDFRLICNGSVLSCRIQGDPQPGGPAFEGFFYQAWNARDACYDTFWVDNMGTCGHSEARFTGEHEITTMAAATLTYGKPAVMRSVLRLSENGKSFQVFDDQLVGAAPSERSFEATFARVEK